MSQSEKNAEKPQAARLDFKQAVREVLRDHPKFAGTILFVDPVTHETHGSLRARARSLLRPSFRRQLKEAFKAANDNRGPIADLIHQKYLNAVLLTPDRETPREALFDLHRQVAKVVVPEAWTGGKYFQALFDLPYALTESAADAYAALRYLRDPGADTGFLKQLSLKRATDFIRTGDPQHLTSFVIDAVAAGGDYSKMAAKDIVPTVESCLSAYTPSRTQSDALVAAFAPLKGKALDGDGLKLLLQIAQATKDPLAAKLGAKVLAAAGIDPAAQAKLAAPAAKP